MADPGQFGYPADRTRPGLAGYAGSPSGARLAAPGSVRGVRLNQLHPELDHRRQLVSQRTDRRFSSARSARRQRRCPSHVSSKIAMIVSANASVHGRMHVHLHVPRAEARWAKSVSNTRFGQPSTRPQRSTMTASETLPRSWHTRADHKAGQGNTPYAAQIHPTLVRGAIP